MPKRRNNAPQRHQNTHLAAAAAAALHSDIDTDTNTLDASTAHMPTTHAAARTNDELNLSVLQRHNPSVQQILSIAPFAVVYLFSPESQQWEKCGVEGTMFVCQLAPFRSSTSSNAYDGSEDRYIERYAVTVLNRKGLENFSTHLTSTAEVEITDEYVILQVNDDEGGAPSIYGLWIFCEPEPSSTARAREINASIIQECASRAEESRRIAEEVDGGFGEEESQGENGYGIDGAEALGYEQGASVGQREVQQVQNGLVSGLSQPNVPTAGQQLDMSTLFGPPQGNRMSEGTFNMAAPMDPRLQQPLSPGYGQQPSLSQPSQRDALLSLFRGAR